MATDYKSTVFLPKTVFPMKAGLPKREPDLLRRWEEMDLRGRLREESRGRPKFILHDGPPYANGHLHIGHALNKILKDVINRSQQMLGKDANYVPGWDCHGLPIEWKIEERYREAGRDKDAVPIVEFRRECREFADHWIDVQRDEFKRLGVLGDWDNPYATMTFAAEAQIAREIGKFLMDGSLYKGARPVMWSVVEKTALADAEVEYHDHTSKTVHVRFPVARPALPELDDAAIVIWTTTPWTIPGNRGLACGVEIEYLLVQVTETGEGAGARVGEKLVVAAPLLAAVREATGVAGLEVLARFPGSKLVGTVCRHPLAGQGYDFDVPVMAADFVSDEEGTGIVHIAPGHGADDWHLGMANGIEVPRTVGEDGAFYDNVPLFAGRLVYTRDGAEGDANQAVIAALDEAGALLAQGRLTHSYPHSWRSKAPLIFRNTAQWFISMETTGLRAKALKAITETRFVPPAGQKRLYSMVETRPDWCISRQRAWGVPIPVFVSKESGEPLRDQAIIDRVAGIFETEGADAWFTSQPSRFLGDDYRPDDYEQVTDIVEVWFESGSTHAFVLEARDDLEWPASLYLEGSDQHRGWFHSSLLESCGTRGRAPYDAVLTHGFILDEKARKMSKSSGNALSPQDVTGQYGADILRLWVVGTDYTQDPVFGPETLKQMADIYRRLRNTLRFLLGNLDGFSEAERVDPADMPEAERWVLHRLAELDDVVRRRGEEYDFHAIFTALHNFCAIDLSAFWFDVRKDTLYCEAADSRIRRSARTVLDTTFDCLTAWLAPMLCFTAEEAWLARDSDREDSVHQRQMPAVPAAWRDDALAERWARIRQVRRVVTGALELARAGGELRSGLEAAPVICLDASWNDLREGIDWAEICITSAVTLADYEAADAAKDEAFRLDDVPGVAVLFGRADGEKCGRCWKVLPDVGGDPAHPEACGRCARVVGSLVRASA